MSVTFPSWPGRGRRLGPGNEGRPALPGGQQGPSASDEALPRSLRGRLARRGLRFLNFSVIAAAYLGFVAGTVYNGPRILSWALDTPYPVATVASASMWPAIKKGDVIVIKGIDDIDDLAVGDVVAFRHEKGVTVHRIIQIAGDEIVTKGDANGVEDKPIVFSQVVGKAVEFRGGLLKLPYAGTFAGLLGSLKVQPEEVDESISTALDGPTPVEDVYPGATSRVSLRADGSEFSGPSNEPSVSADGRYVVFTQEGDRDAGNKKSRILLFDRRTGSQELISVGLDGAAANDSSREPSVSADGRVVAFASKASNLVPDDTNGTEDVFVRDRLLGTTRRVTISAAGEAIGESHSPAVSANGQFVAFVSDAGNLVSGDSNGESDVFVYDIASGSMERISALSEAGASDAPSISADGRFVAFGFRPQSADEKVVTPSRVYVFDRTTGTMTLVSVAGDGTPADDTSDNPAISADGRFVAFQSLASNLVPRDFNRMLDVFVRDLQSNTTERVSLTSLGGQASVPSRRPAISGDGRFVTFLAGDGNIVPGDKNGRADIFIRDRKQGVTQILSVSTAGQPAHDHSGLSSLNFDGSVVAFASIGQDIVEADTNIQQDVFVRVQPDAELSPSNSP